MVNHRRPGSGHPLTGVIYGHVYLTTRLSVRVARTAMVRAAMSFNSNIHILYACDVVGWMEQNLLCTSIVCSSAGTLTTRLVRIEYVSAYGEYELATN